jgi:murein DD-endopeptidase MepM/ murein hydrolase activator NlpD
MVWPYTASIVEPFGRRRHPILNIIGLHEGIDIAAPMGSKVLAAENGIVKRLVYNARAGRAIEIEHSGGLSTFYAHLDSIAVHEKDKINKGDVIGLSGRSGLVTGPHLHFEVRKSGQPVDPMPYLSAR